MAQFQGCISWDHPQATALGYNPIRPGRFVMRQVDSVNPLPKSLIRHIPTAHECPYCHELLTRLDPTQGAWVGRAVLKKGGVVVYDPVPDGVMPLKCIRCDVHFSVLREPSSASPAPQAPTP